MLMSIVVVLACLAALSCAEPPRVMPQITEQQVTPLLVQIIGTPWPVLLSDGLEHMNYELFVTNVTISPLIIESLEVIDASPSGTVLARLDEKDIIEKLTVLTILPPQETTILGPGQSGDLRINLSFTSKDKIPASIDHVVSVRLAQPPSEPPIRSIERVARITPVTKEPPTIGPPLRGGGWLIFNVDGDSAHRKATMPLNGSLFTSQRWAVDYNKFDEQMRLASGNLSLNESFPSYGQEVIAVADGMVILTKDGSPDNKPGASPPMVSLDAATGNCIVQDIGGGYFAFYAHLIPGSLKVKEGQRVRRGDVLGRLGNSGNSDGPHLHFHIMAGRLPLASDGIPYVIDQFEIMGQVDPADFLSVLSNKEIALTPFKLLPSPRDEKRNHEMPSDYCVVRFP